MAVFTMWEGEESGITLKRGPAKPELPGDHDAEMVKEFQAASWDEAVQIQYDHYGWGRYETHGNWESIGPDEE